MFLQSDYRRDFDDLFGKALKITKNMKKHAGCVSHRRVFILNVVSYAFFNFKMLTEYEGAE